MKLISIKKVEHIRDYKLRLTFNDSKVQDIDFYQFLNKSTHPEISKYLDLNLFKKFELVDGDLIWNDYDLVFPIWDLYTNSLLPSKEKEQAPSAHT